MHKLLKRTLVAALALLLPGLAFAQSYPSRRLNNVTAGGLVTANGLSRTLPVWLSQLEVFNVVAYGASSSTTADNTVYIQAAINAAVAAGGGNVFFPRGTFRYTALTVSGDNVHLIGSGVGVTYLTRTTTTGNGITLGAVGVNHKRNSVSSVSFAPVGTTTAGAEIYVQDTNQTTIDHFAIQGGWGGVRIESPSGLTSATYIDHFWIEDYSNSAFNLGQSSITKEAPKDVPSQQRLSK